MVDDEMLERIMDTERRFLASTRPGAKDQYVARVFSMSSTRYHQLLNALLDDERALRADPVLMRTLRVRRDARSRIRSRRSPR